MQDFGVYKVEVIGDAYFICGGLIQDEGDDREFKDVVQNCCDTALTLQRVLSRVCDESIKYAIRVAQSLSFLLINLCI